MERRNSMEITAEILQIAERGMKKSHVAYKAKLNYVFLEHYLDKLEEQGLIKRNVKPGRRVVTTEKGLLFIQQYRNLLQLAGK